MRRFALVLPLLLIAGCSSSSAPALFDVGAAATVSGTIVDINLDPMAFDGDGVLTIETAAGATARVFVAAQNNLCAAEGLDLIGNLAVGDRIEAVGDAVGSTNVRPCESEGHYLRRIEG